MRRMMLIATLATLVQTVAGFSPRVLQTYSADKDRLAAQRRVRVAQVKFEDIAALPPGKNYIVDLTQRGLIYEFSPQAGQIDFSRVRVRTARGEVAIASFIETTFPQDELKQFRLASQAFSLGTPPLGTHQNPSPDTSNFRCNAGICRCEGERACTDLAILRSAAGSFSVLSRSR
jgi:hypothetical protein